ncbi:MAG TPA: NAD(P)-dependent oxidoreductase [Acidisarcina sp.]
MKVLLIGATGMAGSRILKELSSRGHQIIAFVRDPSTVPALPGVTGVAGDAFDPAGIAGAAHGADAIVSAYGPGTDPAGVGKLLDATSALIEGVKAVAAKRVVMIGGAGTLEVAPGVLLLDSTYLPAEWKPIATAHQSAFEMFKRSGLPWTSISPAAFFAPGERTGKFRLGTDQLISDEKGESRISAEDFAIALVDELERPQHINQRFTIGY